MGMKIPGKSAKFLNVKTEADGIVFASKKEAKRFGELKMLERVGAITELKTQVKYEFELNGVKIGAYLSDFDYVEKGVKVVEDVKSPMTRKVQVYRLKRRMMLAFHGIEIREV